MLETKERTVLTRIIALCSDCRAFITHHQLGNSQTPHYRTSVPTRPVGLSPVSHIKLVNFRSLLVSVLALFFETLRSPLARKSLEGGRTFVLGRHFCDEYVNLFFSFIDRKSWNFLFMKFALKIVEKKAVVVFGESYFLIIRKLDNYKKITLDSKSRKKLERYLQGKFIIINSSLWVSQRLNRE